MNTIKISLLAAGLFGVGAVMAQTQNLDVPPNSAAPPARAAIPAVMANHTEKGLLLGIARAGETLVAAGGNGVIVRSTDGQNWTQVPSPVDVSLTDIAFADAQRGWAVGHDAFILATTDGGKSWNIQSAEPDLFAPLFAVQPLGGARVIAAGAFGLLKLSEDGGKSWSDVSAPELQAEKFHINAVAQLASGKLFAAGEQGLMGVSDDGLSWKRLQSPYAGSYFGVLPWGERGVIAFGMRGNIYATADVDAPEWKKLDAGTTASFYGGQTLEGGRVVLLGGEGRVIALNAEGQAQALKGNQKDTGQASSLTASALLGKTLVVVGDNGVLRFNLP